MKAPLEQVDQLFEILLEKLKPHLVKILSKISFCPECSQVFYRNRKQVYCSKTCINRVTRREWLKDPENRKKESKWAHRRYLRSKESRAA